MQEIERLLAIMKQLRDKENGCPWDVEQDFTSIAPYTLEEAYEVVDAIERDNMEDLREELGDLLLQVVFHSQMASEAGLFDFEDVAESINEKMVRRHPHINLSDCSRSGLLAGAMSLTPSATKGQARSVPASSERSLHEKTRSEDRVSLEPRPMENSEESSGDNQIRSAADQTANWERIKQQEKTDKGQSSVLDDVPVGLPALTRAQKLGNKAHKKGFDWPDTVGVIAKIEEEIEEVKTAANSGQMEEEIGDLLFAVVNLARHHDIDAETALRKANQKFETRFRLIEPRITADSTLEEMENFWVQAKQSLK
jgi:ATP diphosphatase